MAPFYSFYFAMIRLQFSGPATKTQRVMSRVPVPDKSPKMVSPLDQGPYRASVIIPTLDRPDQLQNCLLALSSDFPNDAEVFVVSDGGDMALFPDLSRFVVPLNLTIIHAEHGGPAHARNQALQRVNSPIVVFLDDDCLPHANWLENMISAISLNPAIAVGGKTVNGLPRNIYATAAQLILDIAERDQQERGYGPLFFPSNNLAFPAAALIALGGFNDQFLTSEDREICRRWLQAGNPLVKVPAAVLSHLPKLSFSGFWRKFTSYGEGAAKFHQASAGNWHDESIAFHLRVPFLAYSEMSENGLKHHVSLYVLLLIWELANLTGFVKEKWKNRKPGKYGPKSGTSTP